ncbi:MAG TPA: sugar-binding protein, partial [Polyangia bacterium]
GLGGFGDDMVSDTALRAAVSVAGYHYNTDDDANGNFKKLAEQYDKEVWNSEAQATFGNSAFRPTAGTGIGGNNSALEMGNTFIKGFVNSRRTHFIYQPAIGAFYEGGQYSYKELVSARDPWSGFIHYDTGLNIVKHVTWFAKVGWEDKDNKAGIWRAVPQASACGVNGTNPVRGGTGNSYMTLAAPDKSQFSTIFINDSGSARTYKISTANLALAGKPSLELWETRAADSGKAFNSNYMKYQCSLAPDASGAYTFTVKAYSALTVSTLVSVSKPEYAVPLPVEGSRTVLDTDETGAVQNTTDKIIYADNFDYANKTVPVIGEGGKITGTESYITSRGGAQSTIPRYACDRNGGFEVVLPSGSTNAFLRQQLDTPSMGIGGAWNAGNPITGIGDRRWLDYKASVDVSFENNSTQSGNNYAAIGARQQGGDKSHDITGTPYFLKFQFDGTWDLLVDGKASSSGNVATGTGAIPGFKASSTEWHNIALQVVEKKVTAFIDGTQVATYTDSKPRLSGRVDLASGPYFTRFDNLKVETVEGASPYYSELLDDLETYDLSPSAAPKLVYGGSWSRSTGNTMYDEQRTLSKGGTGATLKYTFTGTGLDILGANGGTAKLEVTVDGTVTDASASTMASAQLYQTYALRGLPRAQHTVQLKVVSGTLTVDSVGIVY